MPQVKYKIYTLFASALMAYAQETESGRYSFVLNAKATEKCKVYDALHEQQDCALFFQAMCVLRGDSYQSPAEDTLLGDLSDVICYVDFSNIFDRNAAQKRHAVRQKKAESMFRPEGITLDFGTGPHRYLAFERSNSMSHRAQLSFIREDYYEPLRRRIMLDTEIGPCQLSKLYAYNGLMLSGGTRIDGIGIDTSHRVVVIDNPEVTVQGVPVITVEDDDENQSTDRKKYLRDTDSTAFHQMMNAYLEQPLKRDYSEVVAARCRELLDGIIKPRLAVQYIVALGKRDLLWDLLIDHIEENVLKEEPHAE